MYLVNLVIAKHSFSSFFCSSDIFIIYFLNLDFGNLLYFALLLVFV